MTLITSLNIVVAPRMAYLYKKGSVAEIKDRLAKSLHFVFMLSIPMTLGLIAVGPAFSQWFYGPGYEKVQVLMPICAPVIFIITMSNCLGNVYSHAASVSRMLLRFGLAPVLILSQTSFSSRNLQALVPQSAPLLPRLRLRLCSSSSRANI